MVERGCLRDLQRSGLDHTCARKAAVLQQVRQAREIRRRGGHCGEAQRQGGRRAAWVAAEGERRREEGPRGLVDRLSVRSDRFFFFLAWFTGECCRAQSAL